MVRGGEEVVIVVGSDREREERLSRGEGSTTWIFFVGLGMVGDGMMVVQQKKKACWSADGRRCVACKGKGLLVRRKKGRPLCMGFLFSREKEAGVRWLWTVRGNNEGRWCWFSFASWCWWLPM